MVQAPVKVSSQAQEAAAVPKLVTKKAKQAPVPKPKMTSLLKGKNKTGGRKKKSTSQFLIDCSHPTEDKLFNCSDFEKFLREKIKVNGKTGNFGSILTLQSLGNAKVAINATGPFSKRYLKYLTKKYLRKNMLRDTIRVIANSKEGYELRYFQIGEEDEEDDEIETNE